MGFWSSGCHCKDHRHHKRRHCGCDHDWDKDCHKHHWFDFDCGHKHDFDCGCRKKHHFDCGCGKKHDFDCGCGEKHLLGFDLKDRFQFDIHDRRFKHRFDVDHDDRDFCCGRHREKCGCHDCDDHDFCHGCRRRHHKSPCAQPIVVHGHAGSKRFIFV